MARLAAGQAANVIFRSEPTRTYRGEVARLGRQADRETREFVVDVTVLELPENWAVGQRADVFIETARSDSALAIPPKTVVMKRPTSTNSSIEEGGERGVFVNASGVARWKPVQFGLRSRNWVEIDSGLVEGDLVIVPRDPTKKTLVRQTGRGAMNLAFKDIQHNLGRFALTTVGVGMLLMVVMGMGGIFRGLVDDATLLIDKIDGDLWVVQRDTRGPLAEISRVPANLVHRVCRRAGRRDFASIRLPYNSTEAPRTRTTHRRHGAELAERQGHLAAAGCGAFPRTESL